MLNGIIMHEGVWITDPNTIKLAFINFYKDKFSCNDSSILFPPMSTVKCLSVLDRDFLDSMVSLEEIRAAVWDCGSHKAPGLDGYSFMFIKSIGTYCMLIFKTLWLHSSHQVRFLKGRTHHLLL